MKNCGGCGVTCAAEQRCQDGTCTCNGEACAGCCDGAECRTGASDALCGANGAVCAECAGGRTCQSGSCQCPAGQHVCAGACVDRQTDASHCGDCGRDCDPGQVCRFGRCGVTCGAVGFCAATNLEPTCCAGECVDTNSRTRHCGACDNDCADQHASICFSGICRCGFTGAPCQSHQTCCRSGDLNEAFCRDLQTDMDHCGVCDRACGPEANQCRQGGCRCGDGQRACDEDLTCCGNQACFNLLHDQNNCGTCGNICRGGSQCNNGVCECGSDGSCPTGQTCCGAGCLDLKTNRINCGSCGFRCPDGQTCCKGRCKDLAADIDNCGACDNVCVGDPNSSNSDVICVQGECAITCRGWNFDVDGDASNGCEWEDTQPNHAYAGVPPLSLGNHQGCDDADVREFGGVIFSDSRVHNPAPVGLNAQTNSGALFYEVELRQDIGGVFEDCNKILMATLTMEGGTSDCYRFTASFSSNVIGVDDKVRWATVVDGEATLQVSYWAIYESLTFIVEKTCGPPELAGFDVSYHL